MGLVGKVAIGRCGADACAARGKIPEALATFEKTLALDSVKNVRELRPLLQRAQNRGQQRLSEYPFAK